MVTWMLDCRQERWKRQEETTGEVSTVTPG